MEKKFDYKDKDKNIITYEVFVNDLKQTIDYKITNPTKPVVPEFLYKYYSLNSNSIDAVINSYLFLSHPFSLNDKYDCDINLIDYPELDCEDYIRYLVDLYNYYSKDEVIRLFESKNRNKLSYKLGELHQIEIFKKNGIISLTENPNDILMWSYYTQNSGFAIKLNAKKLTENLNGYGPFPINYVEKLDNISFTEYNYALCVLYQTNIKQEIWKPENEWRYFIYNPTGNFHPFYSNSDINSRKRPYDLSIVDEIILGYDFFKPDEIDFDKRTKEYDIINVNLKECEKIMFLNFIVKNNVSCRQIIRDRFQYLLDLRDMIIEQLSPNKFKIYNSFKNID